ncbi:MAG: hypothetical protein ACHQ1D_01000 [Nitrososphaerales archaeon]
MVNAVGKLIGAFLMLIVGVSLIVVAAGMTGDITDLDVTNQTIDFTAAKNITTKDINSSYPFTVNNGYGTWRVDSSECIDTSIDYRNSSGTVLVANTDYLYNSGNGTLYLRNVSALRLDIKNSSTAQYDTCPEGYVSLGWGRTALDTAIGLFGLGLLLGAIALTMSVFREYDII